MTRSVEQGCSFRQDEETFVALHGTSPVWQVTENFD